VTECASSASTLSPDPGLLRIEPDEVIAALRALR
jgi:hypothetical protein